MAAFRFRLASVLRYRQRLREERQADLATVETVRARLVAEIETLQQVVERPSAAMATHVGQTVSGRELKRAGEEAVHALSILADRRGKLDQIEQLRAAKHTALIEADRAVKSLEHLRERAARAHRRDEQTRERRHLDEVGQGQYRARHAV